MPDGSSPFTEVSQSPYWWWQTAPSILNPFYTAPPFAVEGGFLPAPPEAQSPWWSWIDWTEIGFPFPPFPGATPYPGPYPAPPPVEAPMPVPPNPEGTPTYSTTRTERRGPEGSTPGGGEQRPSTGGGWPGAVQLPQTPTFPIEVIGQPPVETPPNIEPTIPETPSTPLPPLPPWVPIYVPPGGPPTFPIEVTLPPEPTPAPPPEPGTVPPPEPPPVLPPLPLPPEPGPPTLPPPELPPATPPPAPSTPPPTGGGGLPIGQIGAALSAAGGAPLAAGPAPIVGDPNMKRSLFQNTAPQRRQATLGEILAALFQPPAR